MDESSGGIDILATAPPENGSLAVGAEVKIRTLDELLWDATKLGQRRSVDPWPQALAGAAIIVGLQPSDLEHALAPGGLREHNRECEVYEAIRDWPKAWYPGSAVGGHGERPQSPAGHGIAGLCAPVRRVPTLLAVAGRIVEFEAGSGLGVADGSVRRLPAKIGRLPAVYQLIRRKSTATTRTVCPRFSRRRTSRLALASQMWSRNRVCVPSNCGTRALHSMPRVRRV
jgi:hypothetical protein